MKVNINLLLGFLTLGVGVIDILGEQYGFACMMGVCSTLSFYEYFKEEE